MYLGCIACLSFIRFFISFFFNRQILLTQPPLQGVRGEQRKHTKGEKLPKDTNKKEGLRPTRWPKSHPTPYNNIRKTHTNTPPQHGTSLTH
jgi:hypothetical protein